MAEPLFKRTFSRLQGRERSSRKRDVPVLSQDHHSVSSQGNQASKQQSQQQRSVAPPTVQHLVSSKHEPASSSTLTHENVYPCTTQIDPQGNRGDETYDTQRKTFYPSGSAIGVPHVTTGTRLPCQRTYLQNLDSSSRSWVLSSGNTKPSYRKSELLADSASNIWYNPIPEEEDVTGPCAEGKTWRKLGLGKDEQQLKSCGRKSGLNMTPPQDQVTTSNPETGGAPEGLTSPGTVRKISMKMKKLPELRRKLSFRSSSRSRRRHAKDTATDQCGTSPANQNVISRYHLDSSTCPLPHSSLRCSTSKGGYLSDGDSPERLPLPKYPQSASDFTCFQMYLDSDLSRCSRRVSGLLTVHLLGLEDMKNSRSDISKEIFIAIQIDDVTRARTAPLSLRGHTLNLNHTFHLELEKAQILRLVVLTPGGGVKSKNHNPSDCPLKNKVCCLREVSVPRLFKGCREQQICISLEPQGRLYLKVTLQETWDPPVHGKASGTSNVFGVELSHLVQKEGSTIPVPLLIQKTVNEIERRGLMVVGLYRLCGSAAVKKDLRDRFEKDSGAVFLSEDLYPDINVLTGILKDYLRELPSPLITRTLYHDVRKELALRQSPTGPVVPEHQLTKRTKELLSCLPPPEKATLSLLLDHLSLVASYSTFNRMTHQNLAVCFGPVLLTQPENVWSGGGCGRRTTRGHHGDVDFNQHIEVLHYLLQLWPVPPHNSPMGHQNLPLGDGAVVSRRGWGPARLESKVSHRYAGDWSVCGSPHENDYDEVAGSSSDTDSEDEEEETVQLSAKEGAETGEHEGGAREGLYMEEFDAPFNCRLSLKDFDNLIHDLDRELTKHIKICL
ncbi:rho GTPase-activating protein SYDE1 isoform X1 [Synchiropus splendidus]|uniref:rho GTPase-activating protein SYDE1 isoform X1 n=1 Tax=Synchiropus splendidus TaxID=270530 RepID=UPI00237EE3A6|nr:rho GTPase-activating protein SYDE1 isoform X1 [Synchiropus splendidus]